jgi:predicted hydrocarbon binding protein
MQYLLSNPEHKVIRLDIVEWEGLTQSLIEIFGTGAIPILRQIGIGIGKKYAEKILESDPEQALEIFSQIFAERGWGELTFNDIKIENCSGRILITKIPFKTPNTNYIIYGIISGCLEKIFQRRIIVKEVVCGPSYVETVFSPGGK